MQRGLKDLSWSFTTQVGNTIIALAVQALLAWYLGPDGRGAYAVCIVYAILIAAVVELGTDTAAVYLVASKKLSLSRGLSSTLLLAVSMGIAGMGVGWLILQLPLEYFQKAEPQAFHISLTLIPLQLTSNSLIRLLTATRSFLTYTAFSLLNSTLLLFSIWVFIPIFGWGVQGAILAQVASWSTVVLSLLIYYYGFTHVRWGYPKKNDIRSIIEYGVRNYFGKIANMANVQIGTVIIAFFASVEEIGWFAVAFAIVGRVTIIPDSLSVIILPRVAEDQLKGHSVYVAQAARVTLLVSSVVLILIALFAEPFVRYLFSSEFLPVVPLLRLLAIGIAIRCGCKMFVPYFSGINRPGIASISVLLGVITNGILLWILVPRIGIIGAAWSAVIGYFVSSGALLIWFSKLSGIRIQEICRFQKADWMPIFTLFKRLHLV